jgi:4-hydroxy-tetrahydrodipicolinate reductase
VFAAVTRRGAASDAGAVPVFSAAALAECPAFDVAIDFSLPEAFDGVLALCVARRAALVSGTTGLSTAQVEAMESAGATIPVLWASNFSLGVAVLEDLARRAATALADWDADIVEAHHVHKKDAPSGTALTLGRAMAAGGGHAPRYASLRAGDIVGEHTVQFSGPGERIELIHRATDRDIFARGALSAALRLAGRPAGRIALAELLFAG